MFHMFVQQPRKMNCKNLSLKISQYSISMKEFSLRYRINDSKYVYLALIYINSKESNPISDSERSVYISGGPLSALTCCVNVRLLSGAKKKYRR